MRRIVTALLLALAVASPAKDPGKIDIYLARMSGTMVYAQVYQMVMNPGKYIGKRIKMKGVFSSYYDKETKKRFYGCVIADALACCSQGLAFELAKPRKYPEEFPDEGSEIIIIGDFDYVAEEDEDAYPLIRNAKLSNE